MTILLICIALYLAPTILYGIFVMGRTNLRFTEVVLCLLLGLTWPYALFTLVRARRILDSCLWRARHIAGTWYVSRKVGDTIENLKHPPFGYMEPWTVARYKTRREARRAARKANSEWKLK